MEKTFVFAMFVVLLLAVPAVADWSDTDWTDTDGPANIQLMYEGFDDQFPPEGWTLEQSNPNQTWQQGDCDEGTDGKCAVVQGSEAQSYELLISPALECADCDVVDVEYLPFRNGQIGFESDEDRVVMMVSFDYGDSADPTWTEIDYSFENPQHARFWVALLYTGQNGEGYSVDYVMVNYTESDDENNDGEDDDDDNDGCGCHVSPTRSGFALTAAMLLIGLFALLFSLRATRPTR